MTAVAPLEEQRLARGTRVGATAGETPSRSVSPCLGEDRTASPMPLPIQLPIQLPITNHR
ncbi:hypothetical protein VB735_21805 [Halotia wernerae UHCC 0503]|nr:hypothetical protein [Halotia wernerae UHCC 0503]